MNLMNSTRTIALAALVATAPAVFASTALAATEAAYTTQDTMLQTADEAAGALTKVQAARLALFNNETATAKQELEAAKTLLKDSEAALTPKMLHDFTMAGSKTNYLPVDMQMSLTESFKATDENKQALQKAYGLFETAKADEAVDVLRVAAIDVRVSAAMVPYEETLKNIDAALGNIEKGSFFEANLNLKSIHDSIVTREFGIDAIPAQGDIE